MGFWGIEIKPGKPHPFHSDNVEGRLYATQATLGLGSSTERSVLQCSVGHKSPIFLCSLLPNRIESCSLNLEFKDELVAFSVIGSRSIHLSGYFVSDEGDRLRDEYKSDSGEDIAETESEDSSENGYDDDDYDVDFIDDDADDDDDLEMFPPSPVPNSGVVIEEIVDDEESNDQPKRLKKIRNKSSDREDQNSSKGQIVARTSTDVHILESEDEDGFPIDASQNSNAADHEPEQDMQKDKRTKKVKKARDDNDSVSGKKRKDKSTDQDGEPIRKKKKEKQKEKSKELPSAEIDDGKKNNFPEDVIQNEKVKKQDSPDATPDKRGLDTNVDSLPAENSSDKKKKKKKKKKNKQNQDNGEDTSKNQTASAVGDEAKSALGSSDNQSVDKSSQTRTFSNGLVIEELAMGKPDGKRASPGSQVSVRYIGKLKKNGKIFDSNVGRAPFKFRLGIGEVIKGWDVGVNGMRVGDKRRLTIPPSMGYGDRGAGGKIPPNAWLMFDVELVNVR
ncbi:peptidyl-prolyl cis-trans isomerase FKBP53 [Mercurialis annua]|uniref:peptidyl-prolyl cis-trans isomerase FKBP53 n=1 Tax=Mercurialis annua TaxID=3986 RepID=UPI00215FB02E|nr:peptidyl-prolyl cis-trans isomerase FKBP53 [Mercurialis annua]